MPPLSFYFENASSFSLVSAEEQGDKTRRVSCNFSGKGVSRFLQSSSVRLADGATKSRSGRRVRVSKSICLSLPPPSPSGNIIVACRGGRGRGGSGIFSVFCERWPLASLLFCLVCSDDASLLAFPCTIHGQRGKWYRVESNLTFDPL